MTLPCSIIIFEKGNPFVVLWQWFTLLPQWLLCNPWVETHMLIFYHPWSILHSRPILQISQLRILFRAVRKFLPYPKTCISINNLPWMTSGKFLFSCHNYISTATRKTTYLNYCHFSAAPFHILKSCSLLFSRFTNKFIKLFSILLFIIYFTQYSKAI